MYLINLKKKKINYSIKKKNFCSCCKNINKMTLYLQNYHKIDTVFYIKSLNVAIIDFKSRFHMDVKTFNNSPDERELFLVNRYKDSKTQRVFINGKAISLISITHQGAIVDKKYQIFKKLEDNIDNIDTIKNFNSIINYKNMLKEFEALDKKEKEKENVF